MRNALIALFAVVGFGSGLAFAQELKAPSCDAHFKGVMWNFGSEEHPDIRRCDGISYIPYAMPVSGATSSATSPAPTGHAACMSTCDDAKRSCEASCGASFFDTDCRSRCQRTQVQCETKC